MIGGDAVAVDQALTFLALEGRVEKVHRTSGRRQESEYAIVGGEFGTGLSDTVQPVGETSEELGVLDREFPSVAGLADLAHKFQLALE